MNELILKALTILGQNLNFNLAQLLCPSLPQFNTVVLTANGQIIDSYQNYNVVPINQETVKKCLKLKQITFKSFYPAILYSLKQTVKVCSVVVIPIFIDKRAAAALLLGSEKQNIQNKLNLTFVNFMATLLAVNLKNHLQLQNLKQLAEVDEVTGLYNQNYMRRRLLLEVKRAKRYKQIFSIVLLDLNNFKQVNDSFGHLTGDKMLSKVGLAMVSACRSTDIVGRFGGDEFLVILPQASLTQANFFVKRLKERLNNVKLKTTSGKQISVCQISIGTASFPQSATDGSSLIMLADKQLYKQKTAFGKRTAHPDWFKPETGTTVANQKPNQTQAYG